MGGRRKNENGPFKVRPQPEKLLKIHIRQVVTDVSKALHMFKAFEHTYMIFFSYDSRPLGFIILVSGVVSVLKSFGFGEKWIAFCINTVRFSGLVNDYSGFF